MIVYALMVIPGIAGIFSLAVRRSKGYPLLLVVTAALHTLLTGVLCLRGKWSVSSDSIFGIDAAGAIVLVITSILFLMTSIYIFSWLPRERRLHQKEVDSARGTKKVPENQSDGTFIGCLLLFLFAMTVVSCTQHLGVLWAAVEATSLSSAPLIFFHHHHRSLEAAWKYILLCSVGIALALLGNFFLVVASSTIGPEAPMIVVDLIQKAPALNVLWLKAAFIFLLIGYGTKMGLAPLHTWLPDAHSQAPSPVSALLSGSLLNCAFLGIYRAYEICFAAGLEEFAGRLLLFFGLFSMAWAAVFLIRQSDFKRFLAYSSVENMGIIAFGAGLGRPGIAGSFLHAMNHSLAKGMLFLLAGNLLYAFGTKRIIAVRGALRVVPFTACLWLLGFFAITGMPPFGSFMSKFAIVKAALERGEYVATAIFLILIVVIFAGMARVFLQTFFGVPTVKRPVEDEMRSPGMLIPMALLCLATLLLGLYVPTFLDSMISEASGVLR